VVDARYLTRRGALATVVAVAALATAPSRTPRTLAVIGDSWAAGLYADPARALGQIAAARLGWAVTVDAVSGTGYLIGADVEQSYVDRVTDMPTRLGVDVVVLQGGSNDRTEPLETLDDAVRQTLGLVEARFPGARRMMLGPGPDPLPLTEDQRAVDQLLARTAAAKSVDYVSMLQERWITQTSHARALDPGNEHPTVAGQRYLGRRLAAALRQRYPDLTAPS
jgi:lysophospholipase L1-like esterase